MPPTEQLVATVVFPEGPEESFDYSVPDGLRGEMEPGRRVRVPFGRGNRMVEGYCVKLESRTRLASAAETAVASGRSANAALAERCCGWPNGWPTIICAIWGRHSKGYCRPECDPRPGLGGLRCCRLRRTRRKRFRSGEFRRGTAGQAGNGTESSADVALSKKQLEIIRYLSASSEPIEPRQLARAVKCTLGPVTALRRKGILVATTKRISAETQREATAAAAAEFGTECRSAERHCNAILDPLRAPRHETILIHGVTGSGKTEVYMQAIQEVIQLRPAGDCAGAGDQPHAADARAVSRAVRQRGRAAQPSARRRAALALAADRARRSAGGRRGAQRRVCADAAFGADRARRRARRRRSSKTARRAITPATWRCGGRARRRCRWCLASATPSLESWYRAKQGEYRLVEMPRRVFDRPMPAVGTIDLRTEFHSRQSRGAVSRQMHQAIEAALRDGGQVILLLNRRGFSTHIQCPACGSVVRCPHCDLPLTHHRTGKSAMCHYCDYQQPTPHGLSRVSVRGHSLPRAGHAAAGGRSSGAVSASQRAADGYRYDASARQPRPGADRISRRQGADSAGHADDRQGARFSQRDVGGRDQCRHGAAPARLSRRRANVSVGHASGRSHRPRRQRAGACWCKHSAPTIRRFRRRCSTILARLRGEELPLREAHGYPPVAAMVRMVVRGKSEDQTRAFAQHLGDRLRGAVETLVIERAGGSHSNSGAGRSAFGEVARAVSLSFANAWKRCGTTARRCSPRDGGFGNARRRLCGRRMWIRWICCDAGFRIWVQGSVLAINARSVVPWSGLAHRGS